MIEGEFENAEGAEAVGFSHGDFGFVVQALDDAAGKLLLRAEIVEDELAMVRSVRAIFFIGSMRVRMTWRHHKSRNFPAQAGEL